MSENEKLDLILFGLQDMKGDIRELKSDVQVLKDDVQVLKDDVRVLKNDVQVLKSEMAGVQTEIADMKSEIAGMKSEIAGIQTHLRNIDARLDRIENTVGCNYAMTEELYVSQKEANVEFRTEFHIIHGTLDMHGRQISRNTMMLKEYKIS